VCGVQHKVVAAAVYDQVASVPDAHGCPAAWAGCCPCGGHLGPGPARQLQQEQVIGAPAGGVATCIASQQHRDMVNKCDALQHSSTGHGEQV
jgi:hypothetical protein